MNDLLDDFVAVSHPSPCSRSAKGICTEMHAVGGNLMSLPGSQTRIVKAVQRPGLSSVAKPPCPPQ